MFKESTQLEFLCTSGGIAGNGVTAYNLSSSSFLCTGIPDAAKLDVMKYLPKPYMRIEKDTNTAKWSVVCYGISKECLMYNGEPRINGKGYTLLYGDNVFASARLDYITAPAADENITCSYNGRVVLKQRMRDIPVVNIGEPRVSDPLKSPRSVGDYVVVGLVYMFLTLFGLITIGFVLLSLLYKVVWNNNKSSGLM
jgi:hypothetical protein